MSNYNYSNVQHWNQLFINEFSKESDRACVILAVAMLDQSLETLLRGFLVPTDSSDDKLLDGAYAPLSSFSARIDAAYRLGLISVRLSRDLHIIRRIRNEFAHNVTGCDFQTSAVRSRIVELMRSHGIADHEPEVRKVGDNGPRGDFQMTVSWMLWHLRILAETIQPLEPAEAEVYYKWSMVRAYREIKEATSKASSTEDNTSEEAVHNTQPPSE